jgi:hypothetical protein
MSPKTLTLFKTRPKSAEDISDADGKDIRTWKPARYGFMRRSRKLQHRLHVKISSPASDMRPNFQVLLLAFTS